MEGQEILFHNMPSNNNMKEKLLGINPELGRNYVHSLFTLEPCPFSLLKVLGHGLVPGILSSLSQGFLQRAQKYFPLLIEMPAVVSGNLGDEIIRLWIVSQHCLFGLCSPCVRSRAHGHKIKVKEE